MSKHKDYIKSLDGAERRFVEAPVYIENRSDTNTGDIVGHALKFNKEARIAGLFREVIRPGAADVFLEDDVRCLFNHDPNLVLARSNKGVGTLKLEIDEIGLKYSYKTPKRSYALDLEDAIESGDINSSSFGFKVKEERWTESKDDLPLREILSFERGFDVSPVTYPAYEDATVGKRSLDAFKLENIEVESSEDINNEQRAETFDVYDAQYLINKNNS